mgnify:CR=1 FL=1
MPLIGTPIADVVRDWCTTETPLERYVNRCMNLWKERDPRALGLQPNCSDTQFAPTERDKKYNPLAERKRRIAEYKRAQAAKRRLRYD